MTTSLNNTTKIIWLTPEFPSSIDNTKGIYIYRTVKELSKFYNLYVICLYPAAPPILEMLKYWKDRKKIYSEWKKNYTKPTGFSEDFESGRIIYLKYFRLPRSKFHHLEGWFAYFQARKYLSKIMNSETIIHANWIFPAGTIAKIISKKYNVPFLISLMGSDVNRLVEGSKFWKAAKKIFDRANMVTAVTDDLFEKCISKNIKIENSKRLQIDNIYESENFRVLNKIEVRKSLLLDRSLKIILFAGGLVPVKNVDILIKSIEQLESKVNKLKLILAGAGSEEGMLKRMVQEKGLCEKILFVGTLNPNQLINYYNAADLFCLPSKSEGLPNVIVESLFCGTPVVASNVGGIASIIIDGENGFLSQPNSSKDLSKKIEKCLNVNWDRNKIRRSISHLESENVLKKYHRLYNKMDKIN